LILPIVFTVGIIAAVAIPAYQAYSLRAIAAPPQ
jgi:Tfp pilus assembly protein PilE